MKNWDKIMGYICQIEYGKFGLYDKYGNYQTKLLYISGCDISFFEDFCKLFSYKIFGETDVKNLTNDDYQKFYDIYEKHKRSFAFFLHDLELIMNNVGTQFYCIFNFKKIDIDNIIDLNITREIKF